MIGSALKPSVVSIKCERDNYKVFGEQKVGQGMYENTLLPRLQAEDNMNKSAECEEWFE